MKTIWLMSKQLFGYANDSSWDIYGAQLFFKPVKMWGKKKSLPKIQKQMFLHLWKKYYWTVRSSIRFVNLSMKTWESS